MLTARLISHPEVAGVIHRIEIKPVAAGNRHALTISDVLHRQLGTQTDIYCPICDALIAMPAGSVAAYLQQHLAELGGEDALVEIMFRHKGPRPAIAPTRYRRVDPNTRKLL
jgi:hypothetical protein